MKVIKISQSQDTDAWLQLRLGKVTGSKAKAIKPLTRGADRTPQGFWQILAEKLSVQAPGAESAIDHGHRMENEALQEFAKRYDLVIDLDPGMWESDQDEDIAVSPDGAERSETPTWAAEAKCLSTANHLKYMLKDLAARKNEDYKAIDSIPNEKKCAYKDQVIQYFVVNEHLQTLYFVLYDDRVTLENYVFHCIEIKRGDIKDLIEYQTGVQLNTLREINKLIVEMARG